MVAGRRDQHTGRIVSHLPGSCWGMDSTHRRCRRCLPAAPARAMLQRSPVARRRTCHAVVAFASPCRKPSTPASTTSPRAPALVRRADRRAEDTGLPDAPRPSPRAVPPRTVAARRGRRAARTRCARRPSSPPLPVVRVGTSKSRRCRRQRRRPPRDCSLGPAVRPWSARAPAPPATLADRPRCHRDCRRRMRRPANRRPAPRHRAQPTRSDSSRVSPVHSEPESSTDSCYGDERPRRLEDPDRVQRAQRTAAHGRWLGFRPHTRPNDITRERPSAQRHAAGPGAPTARPTDHSLPPDPSTDRRSWLSVRDAALGCCPVRAV